MATTLFRSCRAGRTDRVHDAIEKDPTWLGYSDFIKKQTIWHVAARNGQTAVLKVLANRFEALLAESAETASLLNTLRKSNMNDLLDCQDRAGRTPLYLACQHGHVEECRSLLRLGSNIWVLDHKGRSPLHVAISNGHLECAEAVITSTLSSGEGRQLLRRFVNANTICGHTALHYAVMNCQIEGARLLLRYDAELQIHSVLNGKLEDWSTVPGSTPLHLAAATGSRELIDVLLGAHVARIGTRLTRSSSLGSPPAPIDPRMLVNSVGQAPYHIAKNMRFAHLLEVLNPMMPLSDFFTDARSELLGSFGVLPLSTIAAAALQKHLLNNLASIQQQQQEDAAQQHTAQDVADVSQPSDCEATACVIITKAQQSTDGKQHSSADAISSTSDGACSICFEEAQMVTISSCRHTVCIGCAAELCRRRTLRPAACPLCRDIIPGFTL